MKTSMIVLVLVLVLVLILWLSGYIGGRKVQDMITTSGTRPEG